MAERFASYVTDRETGDIQPREEFSDDILLLHIPVPIEIESYRLHDHLNIDQDALTRTIIPDDSSVANVVDEYGGVDQMIRSAREDPALYIEVTSVEDKPYKQQDGEYSLGTAVFSRSESRDGRDIYGTLREPEVGDLVFHVLKDKRQIRGISTVTSTLQTDFEGPPDDSWDDGARGDGYYLPLGDYREFADPADIDNDLLQNDDYRERLTDILETHSGLFYDQNFELAHGAYFTECPLDLLYLFIAEEPAIMSVASQAHWSVPIPSASDSYDSVSEAVVDVRTRLPFSDTGREWFRNILTRTILEAFTESLSSVQPNAELTETEATHCELIRRLYTDQEQKFENAAEELGVGQTNQASEAETLFFVLFRELQADFGFSTNMSQVKARTILNENYEIEVADIQRPPEEGRGPLEKAEKPDQADDIARQLTATGQMVFYGPPGTGKTYTAQRFARWWLHQQDSVDPHTGQLETVTFHPSFTYEDFIEGLSAETTDDGSVKYDEESGVFLEVATRAQQDFHSAADDEEPRRYVLIIDEINRGNLAQIFGETITGLEKDKRLGGENETKLSLAHSGESFTIPPNLYVIGTMNTADRSIALVDAALRRRFRFLSFPPQLELLRAHFDLGDWESVKHHATTDTSDSQLIAQSIIAIRVLNKRIRNEPDLGRGKQIGHSFLFGAEDEQEIVDVWRFEILPLLEEYLFGQYERIRESLFQGEGDLLFDWDREEIKPFSSQELSDTLAVFVEEFEPETAPDEE
ncbi:ATPase associated with various cellular activities AAA_5 [Halorhabdus utahensis DSM 12940]|uniref:ATPase associated with various cellular activities AAA_5 n=2 Tax=Halorhabdus utahensis TaxID=146826 RepID=C7NQX3_HALUD|nr:ATPase associated with various cellular activities AAA_5 [Halorhabdus utahensis DSM 12940]